MSWAKKYVGIPYAKDGRDINTGLDCWGLVLYVLRDEFGKGIPSSFWNIKQNTATEIMQFQKECGDWVQVSSPEPGDVIFYRLFGDYHAGIVVDKQRMLHLVKGSNACLERYNASKWKPRAIGCFRYRSITRRIGGSGPS